MAETYLLLVIAVLFVALVLAIALGRFDARDADNLAKDKADLQRKIRHLQERNAELRDELDLSQPCEVSLVAEWTAFINQWPVINEGEFPR